MAPKFRLFSSRDKARAAKVFVYLHRLSPAARRVGLALLDHLNVENGRCDPGESRLSYMLGISERQVRNAKVELARKGLLSWRSHGGVYLTSDYRLNFPVLDKECTRIEEHAKDLLPRRRRAGFQIGKYYSVAQTESSPHETENSAAIKLEGDSQRTPPKN